MTQSHNVYDERPSPGVGIGEIAALIASGRCRTCAALAAVTGLSRSTVAQRVDALLATGIIIEGPDTLGSGGRPAKTLQINVSFKLAGAVDVGEDHVRVALTDVTPRVLVEHTAELDIKAGPEAVLKLVADRVKALLEEVSRPAADLFGIGLALPAPVDFAAQRVVGFSVLTGWEGYDIAGRLQQDFNVPVLADNDVNLLALFQHRRDFRGTDYLFYVKAGTGIGSGIVTNGALYRGAQGAAGDIGHIQLTGYADPLCRCGNVGCVEALAGGWALVRELKHQGFHVETTTDVVNLVATGEPLIIQCLRTAGRAIGEAVACATSLLNPSVIVLDGALAHAGDHLLASVREVVYQRALPLATRQLQIVCVQAEEHVGVLGAAQLVVDSALEPASVEKLLVKSVI